MTEALHFDIKQWLNYTFKIALSYYSALTKNLIVKVLCCFPKSTKAQKKNNTGPVFVRTRADLESSWLHHQTFMKEMETLWRTVWTQGYRRRVWAHKRLMGLICITSELLLSLQARESWNRVPVTADAFFCPACSSREIFNTLKQDFHTFIRTPLKRRSTKKNAACVPSFPQRLCRGKKAGEYGGCSWLNKTCSLFNWLDLINYFDVCDQCYTLQAEKDLHLGRKQRWSSVCESQAEQKEWIWVLSIVSEETWMLTLKKAGWIRPLLPQVAKAALLAIWYSDMLLKLLMSQQIYTAWQSSGFEICYKTSILTIKPTDRYSIMMNYGLNKGNTAFQHKRPTLLWYMVVVVSWLGLFLLPVGPDSSLSLSSSKCRWGKLITKTGE